MKKYFLLLISLICCFGLQAQKKSKKGLPKKQPAYVTQLAKARKVKKADPELAIKLLKSVIKQGKRSVDNTAKAEAYFLLGNIYEEIDQSKLALQRYQQAEQLFNPKIAPELSAQNYYHLGIIQLRLKQFKPAQQNLETASGLTRQFDLRIKCEEGIGDIVVQSDNLNQGLIIYNKLLTPNKGDKPIDSLTYARIEAKKAQIFLKQNNRAQAEESYLNSISNVNTRQSYSKKDFEIIEQTNQALQEDEVPTDTKISLGENSLKVQQRKELPADIQIKENLQLADLYVEKGDLGRAASYVDASEVLVPNAVNPVNRAAVFKKSSEIKRQQGDYATALTKYQQYAEENNLAFGVKQKELNQQISILETQKNIDLFEKDYEVAQKDDALLRNQVQLQQLLIGFLSLLLLAALIAGYFIMKNVNARRKANQLLYLKSLRNQMNPHFIFNALNSVNNFIAKNDERAANKFLTDFSRLMRMVLDYSQKDFIPFEEEIQLIELYMKLEHLRFRDKFDYTIDKDPTIQNHDLAIPPMLIQPFIENAIWHGLRYKSEKGHLHFSIKEETQVIQIQIKDDGIGRAKSKALKTKNQQKYKSTGLENVQKRLALINKIYDKNYSLIINDIQSNQEETGTLVTIQIPKS